MKLFTKLVSKRLNINFAFSQTLAFFGKFMVQNSMNWNTTQSCEFSIIEESFLKQRLQTIYDVVINGLGLFFGFTIYKAKSTVFVCLFFGIIIWADSRGENCNNNP